jgi:hypothetical protein
MAAQKNLSASLLFSHVLISYWIATSSSNSTSELHHIPCPAHFVPYIMLPEMTNQPIHIHPEDGNCSVGQDVGQLSTFDAVCT